MKNRIGKFIWKKRRSITKVIAILIIFCFFYFGSLFLFPQWKLITRGLVILICTIFLGIILKLKDIDDLVDKWFFKKDKYQLSDDEKVAIKWIFDEFVEKRNRLEFSFGYWMNHSKGIFIIDPEELRNETIPVITKGILSVLMSNGLIWFEENDNPRKNTYVCRINLKVTKKAIGSDFRE